MLTEGLMWGSGEMRNLFRFLSKAGKSGALCTQAD